MLSLPPKFEELLTAYVKRTYYKGTRKAGFADREFTEGDYRFFAKGVAQLSEYFTSERSELPANYFNKKELRSGYLLYFLPVNILKIKALLQANLPADFFKQPRRILDLGSGPGTGAIGFLLSSSTGIHHEITMLDRNRAILQDGERLIQTLSAAKIVDKPARVHIKSADLNAPLFKSIPRERFDLIILANVLNEIGNKNKRLRMVRQLIQRYLTPEGRLLILEPALRPQTRDLMQLRDEITADGSVFVHAPCLHQEACPMLADNPRDWCHMYWEWKSPRLISHFDRLVGIRKDYLKASYMVLASLAAPARDDIWRVVSGPINSRGKSERLLCGVKGLPNLHRLTRLDRDSSEANQAFERAQRGDLIRTDAKNRLSKTDKVTLI